MQLALFLLALALCGENVHSFALTDPLTAPQQRKRREIGRLGLLPDAAVELLPSAVVNAVGESPLLVGASAVVLGLGLFGQSAVNTGPLISSQALAEIVEGTFLKNKQIECVYKASRDGFSAVNFHDRVDELGSGIVVCRELTGKIFGGYNPVGWRSTDDYFLSTQAFLWCMNSNNKGILKYPISMGGNAAIFDYATGGPNFGSVDLQIGPPQAAIMGGFAGPDMEDTSTNAGSLRSCKATPGLAYDTDSRWPVRGTCVLVDVEVYCQTF